MGGPVVAPLTNLHLAFIEHIQKGSLYCELHISRYLDDEATDEDHGIVYPKYIVMNRSAWSTSFNFLDVRVLENGETTIAHKSFKSLPPKWDSCAPASMKINYYQSHLYRAGRICSTPELFREERTKLLMLAAHAGVPVATQIKVFFEHEYEFFHGPPKQKANGSTNTVFCIQPLFTDCDINVARIVAEEVAKSSRIPRQLRSASVVRARVPQPSVSRMVKKIPRCEPVSDAYIASNYTSEFIRAFS